MALNVLHLCTSDAWGGLEHYACLLIEQLASARTGVVAVCKPGSRAAARLRERGVEVLHLPNFRLVSPAAIRYLRGVVRERRIDAVHVHFHRDIWPASLALRGDASTRLILSVYMGVPRKRDPLHRLIFGRVDALVTSSAELNSRLPELYAVSPARVHLVPYGRPLKEYRRDESRRASIRAQYGAGPGEILVGTMARIDPGKGVLDFAESFSYIEKGLRDGVKYLIVGEPTRKGSSGPGESPFEPQSEAYLRELTSFIQTRGLVGPIRLAGFQEDLIGYLSAMDIFVFPSRDELYSLVMLDAMAMELPIVAAAAGGNLAQVEDGVRGLLYKVADSRDLGSKLSRYLSDASLRRACGTAARAWVERTHDMKETIGMMLGIYSQPRTSRARRGDL